MKSYKSLILIVVSLLVLHGVLPAQSSFGSALETEETKLEEYKFSYATTLRPKPNDGFAPPIAYSKDPLIVSTGIYISANQIGAESVITAIEPLVLWKKNTKVSPGKVFIWDIAQQKMICEQEASFRLGYNKVRLETPIALPKGSDLFVGYQLTIPVKYDEGREAYLPAEYPIGCDYQHPDYSTPRGHSLFVSTGSEVQIVDRSQLLGNLALNVYFQNPTFDSPSLVLYPLMSQRADISIPFSEVGQHKACTVLLRNGSKTPISKFTLRVAGAQSSIDLPIEASLAADEEALIDFNYPIQEGGVLTLSIPEVNGQKNALSEGSTQLELACYTKDKKRPTKPLVEAFVGEWSLSCPEAADGLKELYEQYRGTDKEFNYYCVHDEDFFAIPESFTMTSMIVPMYYPSARVNRFPYRMESSGSVVTPPVINRSAWPAAIDQALESGVSFYDIQMTGTIDPTDANKFSVEISVERLWEDFFTDNRLVVALVEDQVLAKEQVASDGSLTFMTDYRHPNVLRRFCNGIDGDLLTFTDNKMVRRYDIEIPEGEIYSGDISNFKVIAFIARPYDNPFGNRQIFDSQVFEYQTMSSVQYPSVTTDSPYTIDVQEGRLVISGASYDRYEIYDISGRQLSEPLSQGCYIIRILNGHSAYITKLIL